MRLDVYITEKKLCKSRALAQNLIKSGGVLVGGKVCERPSFKVDENSEVEITAPPPKYVGRGGYKLEKALSEFKITLEGKVCVDIGSSTGGFTDCMLQNGAARVYSVDVGHGQMDKTLSEDARVILMEETDIRIAELPERVDFAGADVSFISLKLIIPHIKRILKPEGMAAVLIKPQFEAGRSALNKKGVVKDEKTRIRVVKEIISFAEESGFIVKGAVESPVKGGDGNTEYIAALYNPEV